MTVDIFLDLIIPLFLYFTISLAGSFVGDRAKASTTKRPIQLDKVLIGSIFIAVLMVGIEGWLLKKISVPVIFLMTFIGGVVGFDLFNKICTVEFFMKILNNFTGGKINTEDNNKNKKGE